MKKIFVSIFLSLCTVSILSANSNKSMNAKLEKALSECSKTVDKDPNGRPDMEKFDQCMSKKGFKKPKNRPSSGKKLTNPQ